ncbi:hypothetical protein Acr_28g0004790 [Actinidia rufa]|uniref:Uncharacterized protein n=1 Tax=Actinidia rufa TaxID=165716 RepID=A0A7J0HAK7_9ERIC|nr:hypothetical protein Acr_28g0004790 [Actinidia rufa]
MAQPEVSQPISIILDDSNYRLWSSAMHGFLRARKLWKYITGDAQPPHFSETDDDDDILCISSIKLTLKTGTVSTPRLSPDSPTHQSHPSIRFLLLSRLPRKFGIIWLSGQTLTDFYNKMSNLWNHLAQFEPTWTCPTDAAAFYAYRDRSRLRHFLMALPPDYEHIRASLLHRHPLPTVGQALAELRSEETRKKTMVYQHSQPVLATPVWAPLQPSSQSVRCSSSKHMPSGSQKQYCSFCRRDTHSYEDCRSRSKPKRKGYHNRQTAAVTNSSGPSPDSPSSTLTAADVETIVTQFSEISKTPPPSGLGRPLFTDPSLDIILPVTSPSPAGSPPSSSLPSRIMAVPDVSPPTAPPSVPCPPVRSSTRGPYPSSDLVNPPNRVLVPHKPDDGGDGTMPPHLYASLSQLSLNRARGPLIRQLELPFSALDQLHVYIVVHLKREPGTPFFKGNHYLHLRNPRQPQMRLVTDNPDKDLFLNEFVWVSRKWEFRAGDDGLFFSQGTMAVFWTITNFNEFFKNRSEECKAAIRAVNNKLSTLCIKGRAFQHNDFSSEDFNVKLDENVLLARDPGWDECTTSSSSNYTSRIGQVVPVVDLEVLAAEPILVPSSNAQHFDDLAFAQLQYMGEVVIANSFKEDGDSDTSSSKVNMAPRFRTWGQKKSKLIANIPVVSVPLVIQDPQPTPAPILALTAQDEIELSLSKAPSWTSAKGNSSQGGLPRIMLPKDVADLVEKGLEEIQDLFVMQASRELLLHLGVDEGAVCQNQEVKEENLAAAEEVQDTRYVVATQAQNESAVTGAQRDTVLQDLTELQVVAYGLVYVWIFNWGISRVGENYDMRIAKLHPGIFMEGWLAYLSELGIPEDNPAWAKAALEAELHKSLEPYSPQILPNFNE